MSAKSVNERLLFILVSEMDVPPERIMPSATFQSLGFDSMRQLDFALLVELEFPQIDVDQHPFDKIITLGELGIRDREEDRARCAGEGGVTFAALSYWVIERERIRVRKERGDALPWTDDPILATHRFCNVRREDDRGTIWIRENIRERYADHPYLWLMLCIARQINWLDTLADLIAAGFWPNQPDFEPAMITGGLNARKAEGKKVYTGAYMISAPATKGADKQSYIAEAVIGALWDRRETFRASSLQRTHQWITRSNGWGQFMAYQAVVDMRFTHLLDQAEDVATWAAAGPGTLRGLNRVHGRKVDASLSQDQALSEMRAIYSIISPETGVAMDFSDVPNILCETDKYLRVKNGEGKPRALYVPGRGS